MNSWSDPDDAAEWDDWFLSHGRYTGVPKTPSTDGNGIANWDPGEPQAYDPSVTQRQALASDPAGSASS